MNNSIMNNRSIFMTISITMCIIRKLFMLSFLVYSMQPWLRVLAMMVGSRGNIFALPGEEDW